MSEQTAQALRQQIAELVERYAALQLAPTAFEAGRDAVPPSGKVIGAGELKNMTEAVLDGWLTTGRFNQAFEKRLARYLGRRGVLTTNSGSSANLLAFSALTSPRLGDRAIRKGDEVIGVAAGFPTTVNPILQFGAVPVFVDIELGTYNIDPALIEAAIGPRTKAIMLAHTLGNPFNLKVVRELCDRYGLWLIEDCCDALGSTYEGRQVGSFGDLGTLSFYPAHHITMGEGGAVFTDSPLLKRIVESFRDWGRDCYCAPGEDNTCSKRFCWQLGDLPEGYDHKYTYSHLGYNLKITDMQAACALAQMDRLDDFIAARKRNFAWLSERLADCAEQLILPQATPGSDPSWFGFPLTLRDGCGIERVELLRYLDEQRVGTRLLFAGNLTRQPYMQGQQYRLSGELTVTDKAMRDTFWIGLWPGLSEDHLEHAARSLETYVRRLR
ncbi:lipopolysaccharide biosynthesis protein RfbH [Ectopseudomonas mendocina]|jgi:CDP-6-deoxy-D-xylo-4-hexulose-3-dehydrase|uniref:lipopolysaccharide biosynthesis protein RfbH n=1 Tax=Ectopseudomonas mendocina TaxID=300 RepID=UPI0023D981D0|nr:lipopolysaccharide biosynthesis protein RfbH [Pseudomonas mendocina]MDF2077137.1 lipopolysaccharide biosynthesis protein RfbH [Pseudomonas mendocina]